MDEKELLYFVKEIENVSGAKIANFSGKKGVTFIYHDFIEVGVPIDINYALLTVTYKTKGFSNGKIKDAYVKWITSILSYDSNVSSLISIVNVGNTHIFNMFLSEDLLNKLPLVLRAFVDNFLPSIQDYVKDDFDKLINYEEKEEDEESDNIVSKDIYKLLSSIDGVNDIAERREDKSIIISFTYQGNLQAELSLESVAPDFAYLVILVECHPKALSLSKINKKFHEWVYKIIKPYDKSNLGIVYAEANEFGYMISLSKEMLPAVQELLDGFEKDFLPTVKDFLK